MKVTVMSENFALGLRTDVLFYNRPRPSGLGRWGALWNKALASAWSRLSAALPSIPHGILIAIPWSHRAFIPITMGLHFETAPIHSIVSWVFRKFEPVPIGRPVLVIPVSAIGKVILVVLPKVGLIPGNFRQLRSRRNTFGVSPECDFLIASVLRAKPAFFPR